MTGEEGEGGDERRAKKGSTRNFQEGRRSLPEISEQRSRSCFCFGFGAMKGNKMREGTTYDGKCTTVLRGRKFKGVTGNTDSHMAGNKGVVSFYFSNFPYDWKVESLCRVFKKLGEVIDIYVARKNNKHGKKFGFVRFVDVGDIRKFEDVLKQIWIGNFKLSINVARFDRKDIKTRCDQNTHVKHKHSGGGFVSDLKTNILAVNENSGTWVNDNLWNKFMDEIRKEHNDGLYTEDLFTIESRGEVDSMPGNISKVERNDTIHIGDSYLLESCAHSPEIGEVVVDLKSEHMGFEELLVEKETKNQKFKNSKSNDDRKVDSGIGISPQFSSIDDCNTRSMEDDEYAKEENEPILGGSVINNEDRIYHGEARVVSDSITEKQNDGVKHAMHSGKGGRMTSLDLFDITQEKFRKQKSNTFKKNKVDNKEDKLKKKLERRISRALKCPTNGLKLKCKSIGIVV